jgi:hypothetical protein
MTLSNADLLAPAVRIKLTKRLGDEMEGLEMERLEREGLKGSFSDLAFKSNQRNN